MEEEGASRSKDNFSSFEVDALKIELKTMIAKKDSIEKEKNVILRIKNLASDILKGLQEIVAELREQLANTKEYIDSLKLEKKDLQSKFDKLQRVRFS